MNFQLLYWSINKGILNNWTEANSTNNIFPTYVKNDTNNNTSRTQPHSPKSTSIPYSSLQPANSDLWDSNFNSISLFETLKKIDNNLKNIKLLIQCIAVFISERYFKNNRKEDIPSLSGFGQAAWTFLSTIYSNKWNELRTIIKQKKLWYQNPLNFWTFSPLLFLLNHLKRNLTNQNTIVENSLLKIVQIEKICIPIYKLWLWMSRIFSNSKKTSLTF